MSNEAARQLALLIQELLPEGNRLYRRESKLGNVQYRHIITNEVCEICPLPFLDEMALGSLLSECASSPTSRPSL